MATKLLIAGHGENPDNTFDGGAYGYMTMGEHIYMEDHLFPAMKKFIPSSADVVFHTAYNVYSHGNLVSLANSYGSDTEVYEFHFDALTMGSSASGGHVIIYSGYTPDSTDLALRDAIKDNVGVRYSHKGHKGISGRNNLANVNRAANGGVNYRLLELGFGTNRTDSNVMLNQVDKYAKDLVSAIVGETTNATVEKDSQPVEQSTAPKPTNKTITELAQEVIQGNFGSGQDRKNALGSKYDEVQAKVNEILTGSSSTNSEPDRTVTQVAQGVIDGKYGNGEERKRNVEAEGYNYQNVQNEVNRLLGGGSGSSKSISKVAQDVIDGHYGNGTARRRNVEAEGYNYNAVQEEVNRLLGGGGSSNESTSDGGSSLHLPASADTWNIYNKGGPYTTGNEIHKLTPSAYGGLDYEIQGNPAPHVYLIDTGVKGRVAIYAHPSTGATIS